MPNADSCSFVLRCDTSHLQIAHLSLTLVPRSLSPWKKGFCDSAVRAQVLRARSRSPARVLTARHQFADRAEVCVSQLLLSAHYPRGLLWRPALCRGIRPVHRVVRLLPAGYARDGDGSGADTGRAADVGPVGRLSDPDRVRGGWARRAARRAPGGLEERLAGDAG